MPVCFRQSSVGFRAPSIMARSAPEQRLMTNVKSKGLANVVLQQILLHTTSFPSTPRKSQSERSLPPQVLNIILVACSTASHSSEKL